MKKIFLLGAAAVLSAFTAFSQCDQGGINYGSVNAPCSDTGPISVNIAGFEVWRGDIYSIDNVQAGASYSVDICQGTGGTAWNASLTVVAPSGTIEAFGTDVGSICELSFTAAESGTYEMFVNEVGECPGVSQGVDNGVPRVNYFSGGTCGPLVTACNAGVVDASTAPATLCPGEEFLYTVNTLTIPTVGDLAVLFDPVLGGTGGTGSAFTLGITGLVPGTLDDTLNVFLDNLAAFADGVTFFPLEGQWTITTQIFDGTGVCDESAPIVVDFLTAADPSCLPVTACEAGILNQAGIDNELCPEEATDYTVTGITIPNSPVAGEYVIEFIPVPGSGSGGPFAGELDPSFILTSAQIGAGDENVDLTISIDAQLLTTGAPQIPLEGEWSLRGAIFTDGVNPCDSVPAVVINFKGADEFPCGGPAPCELPYPQVDQASLSVVENANNSLTFSWDPIPGQIGCQVSAVVGAIQPGSPQANIIVPGAGASSFTAGAGQLTAFTTYNFRVRCGCQQNPTVIAGPFTDFVSVLYLGASGISVNSERSAAAKLNYAQTQGQSMLSINTSMTSLIDIESYATSPKASISKRATKADRNTFDVYPNPSTGAINLNYGATADGMVNVRVFDMVGKAVADYTMAVNAGTNFLNLDLSSLEKGIYVVEVREGQISSTAKVVLK